MSKKEIVLYSLLLVSILVVMGTFYYSVHDAVVASDASLKADLAEQRAMR